MAMLADPLSLSAGLYMLASSVSSCAPPPLDLTTDITIKRPTYSSALSIPELTAKMSYVEAGKFVGGLTEANVRAGAQSEFIVMPQQDGTYCFGVTSVHINLSSTPAVYIASEFEKGSCQYLITKVHELKHVSVDEKLIAEYRMYYARAIKEALAEKQVIPNLSIGDLDKARDYYGALIQDVLDTVHKKMQEVRNKRQQSVDALETHTMITDDCSIHAY